MTDSTRRPHHNDEVMCVRGRSARGKEHIGIRPQDTALWTKTACGLTVLPQYPGYWSQVRQDEKCLACVIRHEPSATAAPVPDPTFDVEPTVHGQPAHTHHAHECPICRTKESAR